MDPLSSVDVPPHQYLSMKFPSVESGRPKGRAFCSLEKEGRLPAFGGVAWVRLVEGAPEACGGLRVGGGFVPVVTLRVLGGGFRDEEGGLAVDFV